MEKVAKRRLGRLTTLVVAFVAFILLTTPTAYATNYAGLVVKHGNGDVITRCVAFDESSITSIELLERSGLGPELSDASFGTVIYGIDGEGSASDWNSQTYYWSFWHLSDGGWSYSNIGAGGSRVYNGNVDGWQWMSQTGRISVTLPAISFDDIYQAAYGSSPVAGGEQSETNTPGSFVGLQPPQDDSFINSNSEAEPRNPEKDNTQPGVKGQTGKKSKNLNSADNKKETNDDEQKKSKNDGLVSYLVFGFIIGGLSSLIGYIGFRHKYGK